jgi:ribosomal protein L7/L12
MNAKLTPLAMDDARLTTTAAAPLSSRAIAALHRGSKIEAIKIVRQERNIGLKEAKDAVEQYLSSQPSLQTSLAAARKEAGRRALNWLVAIIALAILAYYLLMTP